MENNYDDSEDYFFHYQAILQLMRVYNLMPDVGFDFSNCLSEAQLSKKPKGKIFETIYKLLSELEEIRTEVYRENPDVLIKSKLLMEGTPAGDRFQAVLEKLSVIIQYFDIKYIPGYTVFFRSISSCDSEIHERIVKNGKLVASIPIKSNKDAVAEYKKKYFEK